MIYYLIASFIYSILIIYESSFIYSIPLLLYLIYKTSDVYSIPHFDVLILVYLLIISAQNVLLFISFLITTALLFRYTVQDSYIFDE